MEEPVSRITADTVEYKHDDAFKDVIPEVEQFLGNYQENLLHIIQDYWPSRTLFLLGCIFTYFLGPFLVSLFLILDLMIQNPKPLYPRQKLVTGFAHLKGWVQNAKKKTS